MSIKSYTEVLDATKTPQSERLPTEAGNRQVKNNAGGYVFQVDKWTRLDRFLILGSDAPTYYASARKLTQENAGVVRECIQADGVRTVSRIAQISDEGRAPKNDPAIFALALCMVSEDTETRQAARYAISKVCRIPTHLFQLAHAYKALGGGFGRSTKRAFNAWYDDKDVEKLAYQCVKYQQREGWAHRDIFRLTHPSTGDVKRNALYRYLVAGPEGVSQGRTVGFEGKQRSYESMGFAEAPQALGGFELLKKTCNLADCTALIKGYRLPRECVPTELLGHPEIWEALLEHMPMTAMVRNLGKMTNVGTLRPLSATTGVVIDRLSDPDTIRKSRIHPFSLLLALKTYASGHGDKGSLSWPPVQSIVDALDSAFYNAFENVEPTGKRHLLALDVSGSMGRSAGGTSLSCRDAAAAFSLITAKTEPLTHTVAFTADSKYGGWARNTSITPLGISPKMRLDQVVKVTDGLSFGATDCALPMLYALEHKLQVDVFCVYTDNETWAGEMHPVEALKKYRKATGIPAKLIVSAFTATGFSIADPDDGGMLDVVGLDANVPAVMREFIIG